MGVIVEWVAAWGVMWVPWVEGGVWQREHYAYEPWSDMQVLSSHRERGTWQA